MLDQILSFIPAYESQLLTLFGACCTVLSLFFGLFSRTIWLSKVFGSVSPADLIRIWKYLRMGIEWFARLRASRKVVNSALFVVLLLGGMGCAGTFEESSGKFALVTPRKAADPALCQKLSSRARWEKALAATGAALTGATGVATWPIRSEDGKVGLAIASGVLAGGTVFVLTLWESDAAAYIEAGCAAPKESVK
jgi:hypothetical protein